MCQGHGRRALCWVPGLLPSQKLFMILLRRRDRASSLTHKLLEILIDTRSDAKHSGCCALPRLILPSKPARLAWSSAHEPHLAH